jgi:glutamate 5-kinase
MRQEWQNAKRIVIKIGSALLVDEETGRLRQEWIYSLIEDIARLKHEGKEVILVASGSKALGRSELGLVPATLTLDQAQAAAAIGQISLAHTFKALFQNHDIKAAQVLLTISDTEDRRRYLNARDTINTLVDFGVIPVVNENDTVATNEIRYGDNDRLSARVASMVEADVLLIFSDIDGLYTAPPHVDADAEHISEVAQITPEIEAMAGGTGSSFSSGGMVTKIMAAKIAVAAACHMVIASGQGANPVTALLNNAKATWFLSSADPLTARKSWIAGSLDVKGVLTIDQGAERALNDGNSLLPAGVTHSSGDFNRGDIIAIKNEAGEIIAHGLSSYDQTDTIQIIGKQSSEIKSILGHTGRNELVHRDNMALTNSGLS